MFGKHKGQFFLILISILVLYFSVLIVTTFRSGILIERKKTLEYYSYLEQLENVKREEKKIFVYGSFNPKLKHLVKNFTSYAREKLLLRNIKLENVFLLATYENITSNQEENLNVTLLNLVGIDISNVSITFNKTSKTLSLLPDSTFFETTFTFTISTDATEDLILKYFNSDEEEHRVKIPLEVGKSKKIGFWVISMKADDFLIKDAFEEIN